MEKPNVSIGICAYNEEKNIGRLLSFLQKERFEFNLKEIIVVASGCTDRTVNIVRKFTRKNKKIKLIVERKRRGKASAVNVILRKAKGEVIVFIGADNIPLRGSINKLVKPLLKEGVGASSGHPIPMEGKGLKAKVEEIVWNLHDEVCKRFPKISGELFAIKASLIRKIPSTIINDDSYFAAQIIRKGSKIAYVSDAITYMISKDYGLFSHLKRRRRIARGYLQLRELGLSYSIPPFLTLSILLSLIRKKQMKLSIILLALLLEILANILAYIDTLIGYTPFRW